MGYLYLLPHGLLIRAISTDFEWSFAHCKAFLLKCSISHGFNWHSASRGRSVTPELLVGLPKNGRTFISPRRIFIEWQNVTWHYFLLHKHAEGLLKVTRQFFSKFRGPQFSRPFYDFNFFILRVAGQVADMPSCLQVKSATAMVTSLKMKSSHWFLNCWSLASSLYAQTIK